MVRVDILVNVGDVLYSDIQEKLKTIAFYRGITEIRINTNTGEKYLDLILESIGEEYRKCVRIKPIFEKDHVIIRTKDNKDIDINIVEKDHKKIDTGKLDEVIVMENPKYLIMCLNTLSLLTRTNEAEIDKFMHGNSYYHSYRKVPIALCEFLDPGVIDILRDVKRR